MSGVRPTSPIDANIQLSNGYICVEVVLQWCYSGVLTLCNAMKECRPIF
jgi:hypothetical protein